ncbi:helix-turn-helix domain-containing protein [Streptomyces daghestanicus]|uniref:helix-turn-helix domain-containing protein n=1 Tax=Streptomyces daghestanicus TaxID=66885 RepID=UPI001CFBA605|nr:helix-turn-helix transcriptional regulator [Streptomyces daghestanicus]
MVAADLPIGDRIKHYRGGRRQDAVAGLVGISPDYLSQIERGIKVPSLPILYALAQELGSPPPRCCPSSRPRSGTPRTRPRPLWAGRSSATARPAAPPLSLRPCSGSGSKPRGAVGRRAAIASPRPPRRCPVLSPTSSTRCAPPAGATIRPSGGPSCGRRPTCTACSARTCGAPDASTSPPSPPAGRCARPRTRTTRCGSRRPSGTSVTSYSRPGSPQRPRSWRSARPSGLKRRRCRRSSARRWAAAFRRR